ncbi:MAG: helix-turn-helix domain-containing protein [Bacteroidota bacterium]
MSLTMAIGFVDMLIAFQSLFYSLFIITFQKNKDFGNYFLAGFLLLTAIHFTNLTLFHIAPSFYELWISAVCGFLYGPILYCYLSFQQKKRTQIKNVTFHAVPLIYIVAALLITKKQDVFLWVHIPTYSVLIFYLLLSNKRLYTNIERNEIKVKPTLWLRFLYGMFLLLVIGYSLAGILEYIHNQNLYSTSQLIYVLSYAFFVNGLFFMILKYPLIISRKEYLKSLVVGSVVDKYAYSSLRDEDAEKIFLKLERIMTLEKVYKTPDLTLQKTSELLDEESKYVSQSINKLAGKHFKEYINQKRVTEALDIFSNQKYSNWRVNEVMYEVGFKSKSSFNSSFKRYTGLTPKEHRNKLLNS